MIYKYTLIEGKRYKIETEVDGEPLEFHVVICTDESEVDELVTYHINALNNTAQVAPEATTQTNLSDIIAQQQSIIEQLKARLDAANL